MLYLYQTEQKAKQWASNCREAAHQDRPAESPFGKHAFQIVFFSDWNKTSKQISKMPSRSKARHSPSTCWPALANPILFVLPFPCGRRAETNAHASSAGATKHAALIVGFLPSQPSAPPPSSAPCTGSQLPGQQHHIGAASIGSISCGQRTAARTGHTPASLGWPSSSSFDGDNGRCRLHSVG